VCGDWRAKTNPYPENQRLWKEKIKRSTDGNDTAHHNNTIEAQAYYTALRKGPAKEEENGRRK
jgi:hypothetical protein